ncbi:MAG: GTP-binding protein, partial [Planctomycetia bacterium]|nr:GTP-binding protein [Planctomycetia bacterium]
MAKYTVDCVRNIVFCGHKSAGKTTLIDRMLTSTGMVNRPSSVDDGTSICDFDEEEKAHRYTIESSIAHFDFEDRRFGVLDTPGYPDFIGQTIGAMRAADTVAIVVNAQSGIEVNTRRVFAEAGKAGLGRVLVVNKMDGENIDFDAVLENIRNLFGSSQCVPMNVPVGHGSDFRGVISTLKPEGDVSGALINPNEIHSELVESIVSADDDVLMRYLDGEMPSDEELASLMVRAVQSGDLIPIFFVSAKTGTGLDELLRGLAACCASPAQRSV